MQQRARAQALLTLGFSLSLLLGSAPLSAQLAATIDLSPVKDNTLFDVPNGSFSNGAGTFFFVGRNRNGQIRRAIFAFDIAGAEIPEDATITNVILTLNMSRTISFDQILALHKLTSDWGEGISDAIGMMGNEGMGANSTTNDATWIHTFFNTSTWTTAGGDFVPTASASTTVGAVGTYQWSSAQMIADVQSWLNTGNNFGWILVGDESLFRRSAKRFNSRESSTPANRPRLSISYTYTESHIFSDDFELGDTLAWSNTVP